MERNTIEFLFYLSLAITISSGIAWAAHDMQKEGKNVDFQYENGLYEGRLDSMDLVAEKIFPIKNQTVVVTNEGYISANYDWENNTKISDGGWLIRVNNSEKGVTEYLFDGWELTKME